MNELSEFLKTERLNRGMSLEAVSERSGISINMLTSIEACDFARFGAAMLIRNSVRAYCKALNIDAEPLILKFATQIDRCNIQDAGIKKYGDKMKALRRRRRMIGLPLFALFLCSAAVFYGGMWVSEKRAKLFAPPAADSIFTQEELPVELQERLAPGPAAHGDKPGADLRNADEAMRTAEIHIRESEMAAQRARETDGSVEQSAGEAESPGKDSQDAEVQAHLALSNSTEAVADDRPVQDVETVASNRFAVEADDKVWIQVKIDDKETRRAMLYPGERREWTADRDLQVVIGNAGGIRMKWNGQPIEAPRDSGRVLRFRLPDYAKAQ
jgi:cytoskeleton protein RodZ